MFPKLTTTVFSLLIAAACITSAVAVVALAVPESSESGASAAPAHPDSAGVIPRLGPDVPFGASNGPVHDGSDGHGDSCNCNCDRRDLVPLYRFTNPSNGADLLTVNLEDGEIGGNSLMLAGVAAYVFPKPIPGTIPVWRYYNPSNQDNFYTTNERPGGYELIGIEFYIDVQPRCPGEVPLYRYWCDSVSPNKHIFTITWVPPAGVPGCEFEWVPGYVFPPPPSEDKGSDKGPSVS